MGFFQRLATLIKSNLNDLISRSEDPEKMLNQIVEDMTNQLGEAKKMVALSIADEKKLEKQTQQELEQAAAWEKRAMLAVKAGNDELAKEALARRKEHESTAEQFKDQWQKQKVSVDHSSRCGLEREIEAAKRKKTCDRAQEGPRRKRPPRNLGVCARQLVRNLHRRRQTNRWNRGGRRPTHEEYLVTCSSKFSAARATRAPRKICFSGSSRWGSRRPRPARQGECGRRRCGRARPA